jgi:DAPG hydrolase PhiG domain
MLELDDLTPLLDPSPMPLETGWERPRGGGIHVAVRTDMHGCSGEMFEWWFRWRCDTPKYIWWHPVDHVSCAWQGGLREDTVVGSEHVVTEKLSPLPAQDLLVQFTEPAESFPSGAYQRARDAGNVSGAVTGRMGFGHQPERLANGLVLGGRLLHVARDVPWEMVLRSHFFIDSDGVAPEPLTDEFGAALLRHGYNEFTFLSRFLPSLHMAENRDTVSPITPW